MASSSGTSVKTKPTNFNNYYRALVEDLIESTSREEQGVIPRPGQTFMLTDLKFEYALSLINGEVKFFERAAAKKKPARAGCYYWRCVESDGWLGFRNTASGTYLGISTVEERDDDEEGDDDEEVTVANDDDSSNDHDDKRHTEDRALVAVQKIHGRAERFCVRHVESGRYILLTMVDHSARLSQIGGRGTQGKMELGLFDGCNAMKFGFVEV